MLQVLRANHNKVERHLGLMASLHDALLHLQAKASKFSGENIMAIVFPRCRKCYLSSSCTYCLRFQGLRSPPRGFHKWGVPITTGRMPPHHLQHPCRTNEEKGSCHHLRGSCNFTCPPNSSLSKPSSKKQAAILENSFLAPPGADSPSGSSRPDRSSGANGAPGLPGLPRCPLLPQMAFLISPASTTSI